MERYFINEVYADLPEDKRLPLDVVVGGNDHQDLMYIGSLIYVVWDKDNPLHGKTLQTDAYFFKSCDWISMLWIKSYSMYLGSYSSLDLEDILKIEGFKNTPEYELAFRMAIKMLNNGWKTNTYNHEYFSNLRKEIIEKMEDWEKIIPSEEIYKFIEKE